MQMTMRWFGPEEDKISLEHIRQVPGVEGVVGALYDVAVGEVRPVDKIERLVDQAHAAGLKMEVIESVNIHDDIKIGLPTRDRYIANYQQTIRNLARFGVKVICYNFMPVFDWMKTDMNYVLPDGSLTMAFEKKDIDKRLEDVVKEVLENSNGFALPGWEPERLAEVLAVLRANRLEPKRLAFVKNKADGAPWLFLVEAQKNRKTGLRVEPDVLISAGAALYGR